MHEKCQFNTLSLGLSAFVMRYKQINSRNLRMCFFSSFLESWAELDAAASTFSLFASGFLDASLLSFSEGLSVFLSSFLEGGVLEKKHVLMVLD